MSNSLKIVLSFVFALTLWMLSGLYKNGTESEQPFIQELQTVKAFASTATEHISFIEINAITSPEQTVNLKPEIDGNIIDIQSNKSRFIKKGEIIATIDQKNRIANVESAEAEVATQQINYSSAQAIFRKKLSSQRALADAKAKLLRAQTNLESALDNLESTTINAPFSGFLNSVDVEVGDYVSSVNGTVIATLALLDPIIVNAYIPEKDIDKVINSENAEIIFPTSTKNGFIQSISRVSEIDNRTFKIEISIDNTDLKILAGVSVRVKINTGKILSHRIPKSAIDLDEEGELIVKTIDNSFVQTHKIELEDEDESYFWVSGLPELANIILIGHQYVKTGEEVDWNDKS